MASNEDNLYADWKQSGSHNEDEDTYGRHSSEPIGIRTTGSRDRAATRHLRMITHHAENDINYTWQLPIEAAANGTSRVSHGRPPVHIQPIQSNLPIELVSMNVCGSTVTPTIFGRSEYNRNLK